MSKLRMAGQVSARTSPGARTPMAGRAYAIRDGQWLMVEADIGSDTADIAEAPHWIIGSVA